MPKDPDPLGSASEGSAGGIDQSRAIARTAASVKLHCIASLKLKYRGTVLSQTDPWSA